MSGATGERIHIRGIPQRQRAAPEDDRFVRIKGICDRHRGNRGNLYYG